VSNLPGWVVISRAAAGTARFVALQALIQARSHFRQYSYGRADVVSTYGESPPPWLDVRQTPGGPFDSGFFFDSGMGLHGGNSPYQH